MEQLFALWLIMTAISCFVASSIAGPKGLSSTGYFFLAVAIGPLAVVAAAASPIARPAPPVGMRRVHCARCLAAQNMLLRDERFHCWRCGLDQEGPQEGSQPPPETWQQWLGKDDKPSG
ncbi:hypothetical protein [Lolliginicoccus levis]|uniref:hypothetical protein n=1 Tax=Lolliginicoccus levis TaxID=2919542 RepID=UPI00241EA2EA|nr:hypothetical protein [Lolliginicoccus levis]